MAKVERGYGNQVYPDAVLVKVWQSAGRTVADVVAPTLKRSQLVGLVAELPRPVPAALARARELAEEVALPRVVIVTDEETVWRDDWLALR